MKILHILDTSFPNLSGYASRAHYVIINQKKIGLNPVVLTSPNFKTDANEEVIDGIKYYRMPQQKKGCLSLIPFLNEYEIIKRVRNRIIDIIKKEDIDLLHPHSPPSLGLAALQARKQSGCKVIYEVRAFWEDAAVASSKYKNSSLKYKIVRAVETYTCKHADRVVTIAEGCRNDLIKRGVNSDDLFLVPNGVDTEKFRPMEKDDMLCEKLGLQGKVIIGYIGTFFDFEGIDDLLQVMCDICGNSDNIAFLLVGGGEKEESIKKQANRNKNKNIVYVGKVPHEKIFSYYSLMDVMVYPRKSTRVTELTTPLKPLEAMGLGKPVICSSVAGLLELVGSENGLFFSPGNMEELKDCCLHLVKNSGLQKKYAKKGRDRVLRYRQWNEIVKKYIRVYDFA